MTTTTEKHHEAPSELEQWSAFLEQQFRARCRLLGLIHQGEALRRLMPPWLNADDVGRVLDRILARLRLDLAETDRLLLEFEAAEAAAEPGPVERRPMEHALVILGEDRIRVAHFGTWDELRNAFEDLRLRRVPCVPASRGEHGWRFVPMGV